MWYLGSALHSQDVFKSESAVGVRELLGLGEHFVVGIHGDGGDLLLGEGAVLGAGAGGGDGIHHVHAGGYLAEGGVLAVQVLGVGVHDEELAPCGVGGGGTGHAEDAPLMPQVVLHAVEEEFALDAVAGAAHAGALGAAALDHKAGDDTVEGQAVSNLDIPVLAVFGIGCVIGILAFSKFLHWLLARCERQTMLVLVGFVIGALVKVWPWNDMTAVAKAQFLRSGMSAADASTAVSALVENGAVLRLVIDPQTTGAIIWALAGLVTVVLIEFLSKRKGAEK